MEKKTANNAPQGVYKRPSQAKEIWRRFKKSKGAVIGLIMLIAIAVLDGGYCCMAAGWRSSGAWIPRLRRLRMRWRTAWIIL